MCMVSFKLAVKIVCWSIFFSCKISYFSYRVTYCCETVPVKHIMLEFFTTTDFIAYNMSSFFLGRLYMTKNFLWLFGIRIDVTWETSAYKALKYICCGEISMEQLVKYSIISFIRVLMLQKSWCFSSWGKESQVWKPFKKASKSVSTVTDVVFPDHFSSTPSISSTVMMSDPHSPGPSASMVDTEVTCGGGDTMVPLNQRLWKISNWNIPLPSCAAQV